MTLPKKFAFVDTETTGGSAQRDRVIEIGIIRVEDGVVTKSWQSLIDPQQFVPDEIFHMTGITPEDLEKAPTFRQVQDKIAEMLKGCVFAAHNARFDYSFLKSELARVGMKLNSRQLCTVKLSRRLYPEYDRHNLDVLISRYNLSINKRHRAMDDAKAIWDFFQIVQKTTKEEVFKEVMEEILLHPSVPGKIKQAVIDNLPDKPGVYIFYGDNGMPLYVGKSINIQERVKSHLTESLRNAKELKLSSETASIDTEICSGELSALLRETDLVKKLQPMYNKQLRNFQQLFFVEGVYNGEFKSTRIIEGEYPSENTISVFRSERIARDWIRQKCRENGLCEKVMGLEKMRSTCFFSEMDKCKACLGGESPISYNIRFDMAFADEKLIAWPFGGPIVIKEDSEAHIFDQWCYIGRLKEEVQDSKNKRFDLDTYKILRRFLRKKENWGKISVIRS